MTKSQQAMAEVIDALLKAGFQPDGQTKEEIVRIPTTRSPLFGKSGGELAKLGGRQRFSHPTSNVKVTVGLRTTYFYRVINGETAAIGGESHFATTGVPAVQKKILEVLG